MGAKVIAAPAPEAKPSAAAKAQPPSTKTGRTPRPRTKPTAAKTPAKVSPSRAVSKKRKQPAKTNSATATTTTSKKSFAAKGGSKKLPPTTAKKAKLDKATTTAAPASTASPAVKGDGKVPGGRYMKEVPIPDPYKQVAVDGAEPLPVILFARRDDVTYGYRKDYPLAPRKSRAKPRPPAPPAAASPPPSGNPQPFNMSAAAAAMAAAAAGGPTAATGDARVALRVIPSGQVPSRSKRPNDSATDTPGNKKAKTKSTRTPSAAANSCVGAAAPSHRSKSTTSEWHPGMHTINGINIIEPHLAMLVPPPPPLVQESTPPRYRPLLLSATDMPEFDQEDASRASIQFLRYIALCVGRINSGLPGRLQYTFNSEQRVHRDRLTRVLLARDGRHAEKIRAGGTRRSTRTRFAPDVFIPTVTDGRNSAYGYRRMEGEGEGGEYEIGGVLVQPFDPSELTDVRVGPMYQTELPQQRRRPAAPEKDESRWIENLVLEAGKGDVCAERVVRSTSMGPACEDERHADAIARQVSQLSATVGPVVSKAFGLGTMGTETAKNLTEEQQEQLYEGFKKHGRDFFKISTNFVTGDVQPRVLSAYYYDVWKLSGIPAAKRWFVEKAEEEERRIAEAKAQEILRAEEAARRAKSMEASNRRRQVKEAFQWVRNTAKNPQEANYNKFIVRERASRIMRVQNMITEAAIAAAPVDVAAI